MMANFNPHYAKPRLLRDLEEQSLKHLYIRGATIDLFPGLSILYIDCILTELIVKTWSVFGAELLVTQANIPIINH